MRNSKLKIQNLKLIFLCLLLGGCTMPCHWYINHDAVFSALSMPKEQEGCQIVEEQGLYWSFNKRLTPSEQFLLDIGPIGLGLVLISIVIVVHLYYLRQRNYTFWDVVGIPFLFCVLCNWMERFIRDFIGDHPPCAGQDSIWLFLFLPLMCVVYWLILQIAKKVSRRVK